MRAAGAEDIVVLCGGVIPPKAYDFLKSSGTSAIYGPGTYIPEAAREVLIMVRSRRGEVAGCRVPRTTGRTTKTQSDLLRCAGRR